jgi:quercetin dioxygenase-like cupin family protein
MIVTSPTPAFTDRRGSITDLIENEEINAVTIITFERGAVRGNHFHNETTQWNYVISGRLKVLASLPPDSVHETVLETGDLAVVFPLEHHALVALEDTVLAVFTRGPRGGKEYETDTYRLEVPLVARHADEAGVSSE